jgi:hypothetical protein
MAFRRADPRPFIPRGLNQIEVHNRKPMERVVLMKPRQKHQNLAIVSIDPMPEHQVTFNAIRDVVSDFLNNALHVDFTNMQPTHLGQAFIRFRNVYDKDRLIQDSPFQFGDVSISFVDHNRGRNWRAVNFNRECWLMLLGYLPDYREDEFIVNTISSFGRVISWVDDERHLSRLLVRARVIDLESVPQFLVMTEGEGFQGESWTIQCEILHGELLGGLPQDEDPAPGPGAFPPGGPFDHFGFGQIGPGPVIQPGQNNLNAGFGGGIPGHNFAPADDQGDGPAEGMVGQLGAAGDIAQVNAGWNDWPAVNIAVPDLNVQAAPKNLQVIDLNDPMDMEEMIIDPVMHGPMPQEMFLELNDLLNQVNEDEEEHLADPDNLFPVQDELAGLIDEPEPVEVNIPALNNPAVDALHLEIPEDELMNDDEIQQQINEEAAEVDQAIQNNIQVGYAMIADAPMPLFPGLSNGLAGYAGPWDKFFSPPAGSTPQFFVPMDWVNFFTAALLTPMHFDKAKELLRSNSLLANISNEKCIGFSLPNKCPSKTPPSCAILEMEQEISDVDPLEAPPVFADGKSVRVKGKDKVIIVESDVRRSPRLQQSRKGFYNPSCNEKQCLGCKAKPPTLSSKVIRNLCSSLCDVDATLVSDEALNKKRKNEAPGKSKMDKKAVTAPSKPKKATPEELDPSKMVDKEDDINDD